MKFNHVDSRFLEAIPLMPVKKKTKMQKVLGSLKVSSAKSL